MCQLKIEIVRKNAASEIISTASGIQISDDVIIIESVFGENKTLYGFQVDQVDCMKNSVRIKEKAKLSFAARPASAA